MKKAFYSLAILFYFFLSTGFSQSLFLHTYGNTTNDEMLWEGNEISQGNLLFSGSLAPLSSERDGLIMKTDPNGNILWSYTSSNPTLSDVYHSCTEAADGSIYAAGAQTQTGSREHMMVTKLNAMGQLQWTKYFGGVDPSDFDDQVRRTLFHQGHVYIFGSQKNNGALGGENGYILKLSPQGNRRFSYAYGTTGRDQIRDAQIASNGNFLGTGFQQRSDGSSIDFLIFEADTFGNMIWSKTYGTASKIEFADRILELSDGSLMAGGYQQTGGQRDFMIMRATAKGDLLWGKVLGGSGDDRCHGMVEMPNGSIMCFGRTSSFGNGDFDIFVVEITKSGQIISANLYGGENDDVAYSAMLTSDQAALVAGWSNSTNFDPAGRINGVALKTQTLTGDKGYCQSRVVTNQLFSASIQMDVDSGITRVNSFKAQNLQTTYAPISFGDSVLCQRLVSIENDLLVQLSMYPNPVSDKLHVKLSDGMAFPMQYSIYNLIGQLIETGQFDKRQESYPIEVESYAPGIYIMDIVDEKGRSVQSKWMKK